MLALSLLTLEFRVVDAPRKGLKVLQAVELAGMEVACRLRRPDDDLDDGGRQARNLVDRRAQVAIQPRDQCFRGDSTGWCAGERR